MIFTRRESRVADDTQRNVRVSTCRGGEVPMQVLAFSTPARPEWRWRIVDLSGDIVEESRDGYGSIATAVAAGAERADELTRRELAPRNPGPLRRAPWDVR
jgi:hypothetical protein